MRNEKILLLKAEIEKRKIFRQDEQDLFAFPEEIKKSCPL
jgi:hypothetical protein